MNLLPAIRRYTEEKVRAAGCEKYEIAASHEDILADGKTYIETRIRATAFGNPVWRT
jgi:hypothetical protein